MTKENNDILWTGNFIIACASYFLMAFGFYLLIPTLPLYLTDVLNLPDSKVGLVLSCYTIAMLVTRLFSGYLVDSLPRKQLLIISILLYSAMFGAYAFAATVIIFVIIRSVHGATWGLATLTSNTSAIDIIPASRRSEGLGYYGLNINIAMAIAPYIALQVYNKWGYNILIITCIATSLASFIAAAFIKLPKRDIIKNYIKTPFSLDRFLLMPALPIMLNLVMCSIPHGMLLSYGVLYGNQIKIENPAILFLFLASGIGLSRVVSGKLVDQGYRHAVLFWSIALLTVAFACFGLIHNVAVFCGASFAAGLGFGCLITAFQTIFVNMADNNRRGTANSTYLISFDLGISTGMLLGGVISQYYNLSVAYIVSACFCAISLPYYRFITQKVYEKKKKYE